MSGIVSFHMCRDAGVAVLKMRHTSAGLKVRGGGVAKIGLGFVTVIGSRVTSYPCSLPPLQSRIYQYPLTLIIT